MKTPATISFRSLLPLALLLAGIVGSAAQTAAIEFGAATYSISESGGAAKVTVTRKGSAAGSFSVDFATVDVDGGTAEAETDYIPTNGTLTFGPGVRSLSFFVPVIDDERHEGDETILINLTGEAVPEGIDSTSVTINDNDSCSYLLGVNKVEFPAGGGGPVSVTVTALEGCSWTAVNTTTEASWLEILSGASGNGNGEVVIACDSNPESRSRTAKLRIANKTVTVTQLPPDVAAPKVTIAAPAQNSRQTNDTIVVSGRASDNAAVTLVEARLENDAGTSDYVPADGTVNWTVSLAGLIPGTNTIRVRAHDAENEPTETTRSVVYLEVSPLTVSISGEGFVSPLRDGELLDVGTAYTAQARPGRRQEFTGWSGFIESTENPLTFTMQSGFVLQANFRAIPFIAVAGTYEGLCYDSETNRHESAGFMTLRATESGTYSARLALGGARYSFSGKFAADGLATNAVNRSGAEALTVVLVLDLTGGSDVIAGSVSDGSWTASILCSRLVYDKRTHPAPQAGQYTVVIPGGNDDSETEPVGFSFGTVTVDAGGRVSIKATLADGTPLTQSAGLSKVGYWPLYVSLYGGRGSVLSWVVFGESHESSFTGELNWVKPANASSESYPNGFAVTHEMRGSRYVAPVGPQEPVLDFSAGRVMFVGGNLAESFFNEISMANNKITNLSTNRLQVSINRSSGLFTGRVTAPGGNDTIPFKGVVYQKQNIGWGFFLGGDQSGRVQLSE